LLRLRLPLILRLHRHNRMLNSCNLKLKMPTRKPRMHCHWRHQRTRMRRYDNQERQKHIQMHLTRTRMLLKRIPTRHLQSRSHHPPSLKPLPQTLKHRQLSLKLPRHNHSHLRRNLMLRRLTRKPHLRIQKLTMQIHWQPKLIRMRHPQNHWHHRQTLKPRLRILKLPRQTLKHLRRNHWRRSPIHWLLWRNLKHHQLIYWLRMRIRWHHRQIRLRRLLIQKRHRHCLMQQRRNRRSPRLIRLPRLRNRTLHQRSRKHHWPNRMRRMPIPMLPEQIQRPRSRNRTLHSLTLKRRKHNLMRMKQIQRLHWQTLMQPGPKQPLPRPS
jgi:hypothetical protein